MSLSTTHTTAAFERAKRAMPLGVTSNFRYSGETTLVVKRGQGSRVWDMDDNEYIDYRMGYGPVLLGHGDARVLRRINDQLAHGALYAHTHPLEIEVAEKIIQMHPAIERMRYANSGTEATMHAVRLARAYTNREKLAKLEGAYHGNHDYLLWSTANMAHNSGGSPRSPIPVAQSSGIPAAMRGLIHLLRFNDFEMAERLFRDHGHELAALIVEPIMGNATCLLPEPGFLAHLRRLCDQTGTLLIFDEVKTGFRIAPGGAAEFFGVTPDLVAFAKALGNGFPVGGLGGRAEIMDLIAMAQVVQGGTYCGNTVGTAAAAAVLDAIRDDGVLDTIRVRGERLMKGLDDILTEQGIRHYVSGLPSMFGFVLEQKREKPLEYRDVANSNFALYAELAYAMRARGVDIEPDPREPFFVSAAHTEQDIDETLNRFNEAVKAVKRVH